MASQNHTPTFLSLRENYQRRMKAMKKPVTRPDTSTANSLREGLAESQFDDEEALLPKYALPPVWVDSKEACEGIIHWLEETLGRLEETTKNSLVVRFDESIEGENEREIDAIARAMTKKLREAEDKLRDIGRIDKEVPDAEAVVRKNVQRNLATQLQQLSLQFRKTQNEYMRKLQSQKQGNSSFNDEDDSLNASGNSSAFLLSQEEEQVSLSRRIQQRDAEITRIGKNIQELAVIFKELATLVIEQGTILDRIDYNMDLVVDRTEKGVLELEKAEEYQRSNRANYCVFVLVVLIVILFILIVARVRG